MFSGTTVRALDIIWVSCHSFRVGIVHCLFFLDYLFYKECSENFENFSQPAQPVGELDQPVH